MNSTTKPSSETSSQTRAPQGATEVAEVEVRPKAETERGRTALPSRFKELTARWLPALMVIGVLLLATLVGLGAMRAGGTSLSPQGMDLAQLARNLTAGRSFTTDFVRPLALNVTPGRAEFYEFFNAPLFPFVAALALLAGGASDATVIALSVGFWIVSAALLWVLALRLTAGNRAVGAVAVALWVFSTPVLAQIIQGTQASLSTLLVLMMLLALTPHDPQQLAQAEALRAQAAQKKGKTKKRRKKTDPEKALTRRYLWAGALLGACYLCDYLTFVAALPLALWWGTALSSSLGGGWNRKMLGRLTLGFVLVALLWWVRNFRLTGNPFYTLQWFELAMGTATYPGHSLFQNADASGGLLSLGSSVVELARKFARGIVLYFGQLPLLPHVYALPFVIGALGLPARFEGVRRCHVKVATVTALALVIVALSLLGRTDALALMPLVPLLCLLGGIGVQWLFASWQARFLSQRETATRNAPLRSDLTQIGRWRVLTGVALGLLLLFPLLTLGRDLSEARTENINTPERRKAMETVGEEVPAGRAILSDVPWEVAWYGKHRALWTPLLPAQLPKVQQKAPVSLALFSRDTRENAGEVWDAIYKGEQSLESFIKVGSSKSGDIVLAKEPTLTEAEATARAKPKDAAALVSLAKARLQSGKNREALQAFKAAAALAPQAPEAFQGVGAASMATGDLAGATQAFQKVLQLSPRALLAQMGLADVQMARKQDAQAIATYERVLADYPDYPLAINNLAYLYSQGNGNLNLALQMARRAAQAYPDNSQVLDTLGWVCYRNGRAPEAAQYLQRAAQLEPKSALIQYHLAKSFLAVKQPQKGTDALQNALNLGLPPTESNDARRLLANR